MADLNSTSGNYAIIVGGGSGSRMQSAIPKQFLLLCGRPVLMHTIAAFHFSNTAPLIILVLPAPYHSHWKQLCAEHDFNIPHTIVTGGETRFHSVKNGLDSIDCYKDSVIAVHDAVRPIIDKVIIDNSYRQASGQGNAVAAVKSRDSVRLVDADSSRNILRDSVYMVQTPQTFQAAQLKKAYQQPFNDKFTDDASVVEETGVKINLMEGSYRNIKITFPEDIALAEAILKLPTAT
ncbi:MAG TPA: 2-C-methyl-D-erythritol 4-phosphate cytidylyltransferase [Mucilaginibacter sp.]|nr:2-C-methyl-D-erythritol 4-phosphate cytidylyltransferase [Mucilaginibacter sp.]